MGCSYGTDYLRALYTQNTTSIIFTDFFYEKQCPSSTQLLKFKEELGTEKDPQLQIRHIPIRKPSEFCLEELNSTSDVRNDVHHRRERLVNVAHSEFSISLQQDSGMLSIGGLAAESEKDMPHVMDTLKGYFDRTMQVDELICDFC